MEMITIDTVNGTDLIHKNIYGHFSENIGKNIYGGIWVGEDSSIPNIRGIRRDVLEALKKINVPVLRWPGGCFADTYHWKDGIGARQNRPMRINSLWGEVLDNNHFGTHEFLDLCEMLGCDSYINCNLGSGTVQETREWIEYLNCDRDSELVKLRRKNGREKPWYVKYVGLGNENWGCGGKMSAEYYAGLYNNHQNYVYNYGGEKVYKIAGGPSFSSIELPDFLSHDVTAWIERLMSAAKNDMDGLSIHYYVMPGNSWDKKGSAVDFNEEEWFIALKKALDIEEHIKITLAIMDKYDPDRTVDLIVDEWGAFYQCERGEPDPRFWGYDAEYMVYQQNTLRDAMIAACSLNIFNSYCDRIHMANLSMTVNQLHSLILTEDEKFLKTPTYHVFDIYKKHQNSTLLPLELLCSDYEYNGANIPRINVSASKTEDGIVTISLCNIDPHDGAEISCNLSGMKIRKVDGKSITSKNMNDHNTFENPNNVKPSVFNNFQIKKNNLHILLDPKSITVLHVE